jgi:hypothetical protein
LVDDRLREHLARGRRDIIANLRLTQDVGLARNAAARIVERWGQLPEDILAALHTACVVNYARPFKESITLSGKKFRYPVNRIVHNDGFDRSLHDHLLELRDKLVAHSDADFAERLFHTEWAAFQFDNGDVPFAFEVGAQAVTINGMRDAATANSYITHFDAALTAASALLDDGLTRYLAEMQRHPELSTAAEEGEETLGVSAAALTSETPDSQSFTARVPDVGAAIKPPPIERADARYNHTTLLRKRRAEGEVEIIDPNGKARRVQISSKNS